MSIVYDKDGITLIHGDFFKDVPEGLKADMIWADIPYGITVNKWDNVWDLQGMWESFNRIKATEDTVAVLTASEPFNIDLVNSNRKEFKYSWIWVKSNVSGTLNAKKRPLKKHELVLIFYKKYGKYFPIITSSDEPVHNKGEGTKGTENYGKIRSSSPFKAIHGAEKESCSENYSRPIDKSNIFREIPLTSRYPVSTLLVNSTDTCIGKKEGRIKHPTEKPVLLVQYMIETYTKPGELVFDPCFGTGASAVAAKKTGRRYVGVEIDSRYVEAAVHRLNLLDNIDK